MLSESQILLLGWLRSQSRAHLEDGRPSRALRLTLGALNLLRRHLDTPGIDETVLFSLLSDAGAQFLACGRPDRATECLGEALARVAGLPEGSVSPAALAEAHQHLGSALDLSGDAFGAAEHWERALELLEATDPPPLVTIAHLANNLGMIRRNEGRFDVAAALYRRSQAIFEALGPAHELDLATVCNNQGTLFWAWNQPALARDFHLVALKLRRDHLPATHADIGQSASNLAAVYHDLGDLDRAGKNYLRALRILHHDLAAHRETYEIAAGNYADLLEAAGKPGKAQRLRQQTGRHLARSRREG